MWDPDYSDFIMNYYSEELGVEPPLSDSDDDDEEWEQESEEEEEDDNDDVAEVDGDSGTTTLRQVLYGNHGNDINFFTTTSSSQEVLNVDSQGSENANDVTVEVECESRARINNDGSKVAETASLKGDGNGEQKNEGDFNRGEIEGLYCPICFEPWSSGGDHNVCCLPCGHIYGLSCIKKWLRRQGSSKCPQCKETCRIKDIRLLYATQIVAVDGELQKTVQSLEVKCASLEKKNADWSKTQVEWKKREADLCNQVHYLKERTHDLEDLLEVTQRRAFGSSASQWNRRGDSALDASPIFHARGSNKFRMQNDFQIDGARLFDIDSSSQIFVIARRLSGMGGLHVLTKMSLLSGHKKEDIRLPENTKAVKDLRVSPHAGLVLLASLGKKLSVLSMESNNTILTYDLPAAAWSCSWDIRCSHYVYAGLQNGTVLQFDMRHTTRHVESLNGLTSNPIHTVQSLLPDSSLSSGSVLTASSLGLCQWNFGRNEQRPYLIPESENQGVCISLAYCPTSDDIVASYRPKIAMFGDLEISQPPLTASASIASGQCVGGSHVLYKKMGCTYQKLGSTLANVSDIRLPKSAIIEGVSGNPMFASGDEVTGELVLQELPSLMVVEHLKPRKYPIRDVKYIRLSSSGLLSCLGEDSLQLFTAKLV